MRKLCWVEAAFGWEFGPEHVGSRGEREELFEVETLTDANPASGRRFYRVVAPPVAKQARCGNSLTAVCAACRKPPFMKSKAGPKYQRILLKLSGEALGGQTGTGIDAESVTDMARQIREVRELGSSVVVVIGGGNIFSRCKGVSGASNVQRATTWACLRR